MDDLPDKLTQLAARLETLERRVFLLEHSTEAPALLPAPGPRALLAIQAPDERAFGQSGGVFSVLGKAMLGIAGAYLLRAVAEVSALPKLAVAAVAIAYALGWLVFAARTKSGEWIASGIYASTSALILAPLLWELTLRFTVLPTIVTAGLLSAFVISASLLAWGRNQASIFWVANVAAAVTALALLVATHDLAPFIAALLLMAVICEYAAVRNRDLSVRPLIAIAADLAVWALVFIYAGPQSARVEYPALGRASLLAPGCLLFLIYAVSVAFKTVRLKRRITVFEAGQTLVAFLLAACSLLYFDPGSGATVLGLLCLLLSSVSYAVLFRFLDGNVERRNYRVFATWSVGLLVAGGWLCLAPPWLAVCLGLAAIVATVSGARFGRLTLELHGVVYLVAAAASCGLPAYIFGALVGAFPSAPAWIAGFVCVCAAACYAAGRPLPGARAKERLLQLIPACLAVCFIAALAVRGLASLMSLRMTPEVFHVAFIRTLAMCTTAFALAFFGSRWRRIELSWIAYAALVFVAAKLLFEDLRLGHLGFIAASIFLFAVTLIAVPRLARWGQNTEGGTAGSHMKSMI